MLGVSQPAAVKLADRLGLDGLLERRPGPRQPHARAAPDAAGPQGGRSGIGRPGHGAPPHPRCARSPRTSRAGAAAGEAGGGAGRRSPRGADGLPPLRPRQLLRRRRRLPARPHRGMSASLPASQPARARVGGYRRGGGVVWHGALRIRAARTGHPCELRIDQRCTGPARGRLIPRLPGGDGHSRPAVRPSRRPRDRRRGRRLRGGGDDGRRTGSGPDRPVPGALGGRRKRRLVFPPFSDLVALRVGADRRGRILSAISSGTGWGVALAAPVACSPGRTGGWPGCCSRWSRRPPLAGRSRCCPAGWARGPARAVDLRTSWFLCPRSGPLLVGALLVGWPARSSGPSLWITW